MCSQPLPPPLSLPSAKLMIMDLEKYGYQSRRGIRPELANKGSYGSGMEYSVEDVKRVVEFGLENGVRIIPEIDMPGHTGSWAEAYPEIVACANMFWWPEGVPWEERLATEPGTGHLNPLIPKTYEVVKNVFKEVATLFPDTFFHGGADNVVP
ncbi:beta-hexosaminidase 2, partial [Tanacetum coccineum]